MKPKYKIGDILKNDSYNSVCIILDLDNDHLLYKIQYIKVSPIYDLSQKAKILDRIYDALWCVIDSSREGWKIDIDFKLKGLIEKI